MREYRAKAAHKLFGDELCCDARDCLGLHQEQEAFGIIVGCHYTGQAVDPHMHGPVEDEVDIEIDEWDLLNLGLGNIGCCEASGEKRRAIRAGARCCEHGDCFACPRLARRGSIRSFHAMV